MIINGPPGCCGFSLLRRQWNQYPPGSVIRNQIFFCHSLNIFRSHFFDGWKVVINRFPRKGNLVPCEEQCLVEERILPEYKGGFNMIHYLFQFLFSYPLFLKALYFLIECLLYFSHLFSRKQVCREGEKTRVSRDQGLVSLSTEYKPFLPDKALVEPGAFASGEKGGDHFQHVAILLSKVRDMLPHYEEWKLSFLIHEDPSLPNLGRVFISILIRSYSF